MFQKHHILQDMFVEIAFCYFRDLSNSHYAIFDCSHVFKKKSFLKCYLWHCFLKKCNFLFVRFFWDFSTCHIFNQKSFFSLPEPLWNVKIIQTKSLRSVSKILNFVQKTSFFEIFKKSLSCHSSTPILHLNMMFMGLSIIFIEFIHGDLRFKR